MNLLKTFKDFLDTMKGMQLLLYKNDINSIIIQNLSRKL